MYYDIRSEYMRILSESKPSTDEKKQLKKKTFRQDEDAWSKGNYDKDGKLEGYGKKVYNKGPVLKCKGYFKKGLLDGYGKVEHVDYSYKGFLRLGRRLGIGLCRMLSENCELIGKWDMDEPCGIFQVTRGSWVMLLILDDSYGFGVIYDQNRLIYYGHTKNLKLMKGVRFYYENNDMDENFQYKNTNIYQEVGGEFNEESCTVGYIKMKNSLYLGKMRNNKYEGEGILKDLLTEKTTKGNFVGGFLENEIESVENSEIEIQFKQMKSNSYEDYLYIIEKSINDRIKSNIIKKDFSFPDSFDTTATYFGTCKNNTMNGKGKITYSNGDSYEGMFKDGQYDKKGIYITRNGDVSVITSKHGKIIKAVHIPQNY